MKQAAAGSHLGAIGGQASIGKKPEAIELQASRIGAHPSHALLAIRDNTISHYNTFSYYLHQLEQDFLLLVVIMTLLQLYYFIAWFKEVPIVATRFTILSCRWGNLIAVIGFGRYQYSVINRIYERENSCGKNYSTTKM